MWKSTSNCLLQLLSLNVIEFFSPLLSHDLTGKFSIGSTDFVFIISGYNNEFCNSWKINYSGTDRIYIEARYMFIGNFQCGHCLKYKRNIPSNATFLIPYKNVPHNSQTYGIGIYQMRCTAYKVAPDDGLI